MTNFPMRVYHSANFAHNHGLIVKCKTDYIDTKL